MQLSISRIVVGASLLAAFLAPQGWGGTWLAASESRAGAASEPGESEISDPPPISYDFQTVTYQLSPRLFSSRHAVGVAIDLAGNLYISAESFIRKVSPMGRADTLAGAIGEYGHVDGPGKVARFRGAHGLAVDAAGNVYVADSLNHVIRKVTPDGQVSTVAGDSSIKIEGNPIGGYADGPGTSARFNHPQGLAVDAAGVIYVADSANCKIRKVAVDGTVSTLAGSTHGYADGPGTSARFWEVTDVVVDGVGNLYVADYGNSVIRRITPDGQVTTWAGAPGLRGYEDATGDAARFSSPIGLAIDPFGNLVVADFDNLLIRRISASRQVTTLAGAAKKSGQVDGIGQTVRFSNPYKVAVNEAGAVYVADGQNGIRKGWPADGPPRIRTQPVSQVMAQTFSVTLAVWATGSQPLTYQWRRNGIPIPGATLAHFTIERADISDAGTYSVQVSNNAGAEISAEAKLEVEPKTNLTPVIWGAGATDLEVSGRWAYLATAPGLEVYDIQEPAHPVRVSLYRTSVAPSSIAVSGHHLYMTVAEPGPDRSAIQVLDLTNPANPLLVRTLPLANSATIRGMWANRLYLTYPRSAGSSLVFVDVSNPNDPQMIGTFDLGGNHLTSMALSDGYAWVTKGAGANGVPEGGLEIIDISNGAQPFKVGQLLFDTAYGVAVSGRHAYVGTADRGLQVIDVGNSSNPVLVTNIASEVLTFAVAVSGDHAYTLSRSSDGRTGLDTFDISNPASPVLRSRSLLRSAPESLVVSGSHAFLVSPTAGLMVFDVTRPTAPVLASGRDVGGAYIVTASGNHAYVASYDQTQTFRVIDVQNPALPVGVGEVALPGHVWDMFQSGSHFYLTVADWTDGRSDASFHILDITDPTKPQFTANVALGPIRSQRQGVRVADGYAYIAAGSMHVFDVLDPAKPAQVATIELGNWKAFGIELAGRYAYVASENSGSRFFFNHYSLQVLDISDPRQPVHLGGSDGVPGDEHGGGMAIRGQHLYLSAGHLFYAFDISNPANPATVPGVDWSGDQMAISGRHAYSVPYSGSIQVWDLTEPAQPLPVGNEPAEGGSVAVSGPYLYLASWPTGLRIWRIDRAPRLEIFSAKGSPTLELRGEPNRQYIVEQTFGLPGNWVPLPALTPTNEVMSIPLPPIPAGEQSLRFFRARQAP